MKRFFEYLPLFIAAALSYAVIYTTIETKGRKRLDEQARFLAPPPEHIETMHFGFSQSVADSLWLRWIQDGDVCYSYLVSSILLPVYSPQKSQAEDRFFSPRHKNCDSSWGYKMLDAITKLDRRFRMPYAAGTMTLSVLVEDYEGASALFERGLSVYPDDWELNYRAAYHFLFDVKDYKRAAELLNHSADVGGPSWLKSLAARLYTKTGQLELGISSLIDFRKTYKEGAPGLVELNKRIAELQRLQAAEQRKSK